MRHWREGIERKEQRGQRRVFSEAKAGRVMKSKGNPEPQDNVNLKGRGQECQLSVGYSSLMAKEVTLPGILRKAHGRNDLMDGQRRGMEMKEVFGRKSTGTKVQQTTEYMYKVRELLKFVSRGY